jgi:hypothetical protein
MAGEGVEEVTMLTTPEIMAQSLDALAVEIGPEDPVVLSAITEAADHVRHLGAIKAWWERAGGIDQLSDLMDAIP